MWAVSLRCLFLVVLLHAFMGTCSWPTGKALVDIFMMRRSSGFVRVFGFSYSVLCFCVFVCRSMSRIFPHFQFLQAEIVFLWILVGKDGKLLRREERCLRFFVFFM